MALWGTSERKIGFNHIAVDSLVGCGPCSQTDSVMCPNGPGLKEKGRWEEKAVKS